MIQLNFLAFLFAAAIAIYFILRTNAKKIKSNKVSDSHNGHPENTDLFEESMKDVINPERQWNSCNIHHRNHDAE
ncbi:hypothetical protein [Delftia sp. JD2]|uniref:hypothetical protein n=1 Tax=Delftia sp. JD2 TaxID=469553 RepID=UPI0011128566|nr:hypothetical protein [Delftia sp. JD2]